MHGYLRLEPLYVWNVGHESIITTEIYTHLNEAHLLKTVEEHLPL